MAEHKRESRLLGASPLMRDLKEQIPRVAASGMTVLISGETGTGKGVLAREIHEHSARGPFWALNCGAIAEHLVESELFGHERGAFSSAVTRTDGVFRAAQGGTLFLDEISEMPLAQQPKLLQVLEERQVVRVGGTRAEPIDVRIICATNRDLQDEVAAGTFRKDLYYRINTYLMDMPPLRRRGDDVLLLAESFLAEHAGASVQLSEEARALIKRCPWYGNVRELHNALLRALLRCSDRIIRAADIQLEPHTSSPGPLRPADLGYERVPRPALVKQVVEEHLQRERVAVLLAPNEGGAKTLARQIACRYAAVLWLKGYASATCAPEEFYRQLTRTRHVVNQTQLHDWLLNQPALTEDECLVVLMGTQGPESLLNEVASVFLSLRQSDRRRYAFLIVGGRRVLELRKVEEYFWNRLVAGGACFDVPGLSEDEISQLLRLRGQPLAPAALLQRATGGCPHVLYKLLTGRAAVPLDEAGLDQRVKEILATTLELEHLRSDAAAREVLQRLLRSERVAPLGDVRVRRNPFAYAESRLYFDGFLRWSADGATQLRCAAVRLLLEGELLLSARPS